jgi:hypothetical protein
MSVRLRQNDDFEAAPPPWLTQAGKQQQIRDQSSDMAAEENNLGIIPICPGFGGQKAGRAQASYMWGATEDGGRRCEAILAEYHGATGQVQ